MYDSKEEMREVTFEDTGEGVIAFSLLLFFLFELFFNPISQETI